VFTADGSVMTANVFPRQPGNRGVALFAKGEPFVVRSLRIWRLKSPLAKG